MQLSNEESKKLEMARSIVRLESEPAWKAMTEALLAGEAESLSRLEGYLETEAHPDREEVMTLCIQWAAIRKNRKILLRNVQEAKDYKKDLGNSLLKEFAQDPSQPVPEDLRDLLLETV